MFLKFTLTCYACPEQYDVVDLGTGNTVAYVRLRWGSLTVRVPDHRGDLIYEYQFEDELKGVFSVEERFNFIETIANKIVKHYKTTLGGIEIDSAYNPEY